MLVSGNFHLSIRSKAMMLQFRALEVRGTVASYALSPKIHHTRNISAIGSAIKSANNGPQYHTFALCKSPRGMYRCVTLLFSFYGCVVLRAKVASIIWTQFGQHVTKRLFPRTGFRCQGFSSDRPAKSFGGVKNMQQQLFCYQYLSEEIHKKWHESLPVCLCWFQKLVLLKLQPHSTVI